MERKVLCTGCRTRVALSTVDETYRCASCVAMHDNYNDIGDVLPEVSFSDKENEIIIEDQTRHPALKHPGLFKEVLKRYAIYENRNRIVAFIKAVNGIEISVVSLFRCLTSPKYKPIVENIRLRADESLSYIPITSLNYRMRRMNSLYNEANQLEGAEKIAAKRAILAEAHKMTHGSKLTVNKTESKTLTLVLQRIEEKNKALPERKGIEIPFAQIPEQVVARA